MHQLNCFRSLSACRFMVRSFPYSPLKFCTFKGLIKVCPNLMGKAYWDAHLLLFIHLFIKVDNFFT